MTVIRKPAVAGLFDPADAGELQATVSALLDEVPPAGGAAAWSCRAWI